MRIVFIGVSHWHTPFYLGPALTLPDSQVIGVSDPALARARPVAAQAGCRAWADYRDMCSDTRPEFAFVLGRHCDMAETARFLITFRIPFAIEKPAGINTAEVSDIAARAAEVSLFAAVPFVFRQSPMHQAFADTSSGDPVQYAAFKFIGGLTERYREAHCEWMLQRATAGGGALLNLGVHFLDLCRVLMPQHPLVLAGATISSLSAGCDVEDHAAVLLRAGAATCLVETGYLLPAATAVFDLHYSIRTDRHYFIVRDAETLEIVDRARQRRFVHVPTVNVPLYPAFVADTLRRISRGDPPIAGLNDMAAAMQLVEAAYRTAAQVRAGL